MVMFCRYALPFVWRVLLFLAWMTVAPAYGQDRTTDIGRAETQLAKLISEWESRASTTLDPRLLRELAGELVHFREIFGYDYSSNPRRPIARIDQMLADHGWLGRVVHEHLAALNQSPTQTKNLFGRLAIAIGSAAEQAGWPSMVQSDYVLNDLSSQLPPESFVLISEGLATRNYSNHRKFLVGAGSHVVQTQSGRTWNFTVKGTNRSGAGIPQGVPSNPQGRGR